MIFSGRKNLIDWTAGATVDDDLDVFEVDLELFSGAFAAVAVAVVDDFSVVAVVPDVVVDCDASDAADRAVGTLSSAVPLVLADGTLIEAPLVEITLSITEELALDDALSEGREDVACGNSEGLDIVNLARNDSFSPLPVLLT